MTVVRQTEDILFELKVGDTNVRLVVTSHLLLGKTLVINRDSSYFDMAYDYDSKPYHLPLAYNIKLPGTDLICNYVRRYGACCRESYNFPRVDPYAQERVVIEQWQQTLASIDKLNNDMKIFDVL